MTERKSKPIHILPMGKAPLHRFCTITMKGPLTLLIGPFIEFVSHMKKDPSHCHFRHLEQIFFKLVTITSNDYEQNEQNQDHSEVISEETTH